MVPNLDAYLFSIHATRLIIEQQLSKDRILSFKNIICNFTLKYYWLKWDLDFVG